MVRLRNGGWLVAALAAVCWAAGCAGVERQTAGAEVKAFFLAANAAKFQGAKQCLNSQTLDLSAYDQLLEVKYPPTTQVDVLTEPPKRPHQPFAVLTAPQNAAPEAFTQKAREIGADAIILCRPPAAGARPEAVAIKYRVERSGGHP